MTTELIVDDHLLLRVLLDDEPSSLRPDGAEIATTGLWYHRLCLALADDGVIGSISRLLGQVDTTVAAGIVEAVIDLPETIEMVSLRRLGRPMALLAHSGVGSLNLLSLEALAAAEYLRATEICLAEVDANEPLKLASQKLGVNIRLVAG